MAAPVKPTGERFFPSLGPGGTYLIGLKQVGIHTVTATLGFDTANDNAVLVAAPPNTSTAGISYGPIVHSLGTVPTAVIPIKCGTVTTDIQSDISYVTADNSAVYLRCRNFTGGAGHAAYMINIIR